MQLVACSGTPSKGLIAPTATLQDGLSKQEPAENKDESCAKCAAIDSAKEASSLLPAAPYDAKGKENQEYKKK
jgi:hypothetical protein